MFPFPQTHLQTLVALLAMALPAALFAQEARTLPDSGGDPAATISIPAQAAALPESLLLTGIAAIGTQKYVYLTNPVTSQSIELISGAPGTNGIELVRCKMRGWWPSGRF